MGRFAIALILAGVAAAQSRTPVVVELFTSEGCSSCPPADDLLWRLESASPSLSIEVIALSEHVDYWNQLGWQDRFSSPLFSARQQEYGRAFRQDNVYTPQIVINGQTEVLGSDSRRVLQEIRRAADGSRANIEMTLLSPESLRLKVESVPADTQDADILLAITETQLATSVQAGENTGRLLRHTGVVRSLVSLGRLDRKKAGAYSADVALRFRPEWRRPNLKLVLLVQDRSSRRIVGAASLHL